jgi:glycosyltransferase involved in cell wall biosynthesis
MTGGTGPLVSAAMIVRDEAATLGRCLASIADWCDELVIVDTGSVDDTLDVARSYGARVDTLPWTGDFAAARNRSLDLATGDWILYIDADEWLEPLDRNTAHAELRAHADAAAVRVWFRQRPGYSPYREYRLWPHRADVRFSGRIHETMLGELRRISADEGRPIVDSDLFRILHDGYEGDQTAKHRRNLPLLEQRVVELPNRVYLWNHLGDVRAALGDRDGALDAWARGVAVVRRFGVAERVDVLAYGSLGLALIDAGEDITDLVDEVELLAPWYLTTLWLRGRNHLQQGRAAEAIPPLRRLVEIGPDPGETSLAYSNAMFTDWAWEAWAEALVQLGDRSGAAEVFATAAAARPDRADYRVKSVALAASARHDQSRGDQLGERGVDGRR